MIKTWKSFFKGNFVNIKTIGLKEIYNRGKIKMIFAIVAALLAYKKAKDSGRNGILWAFIAVGVFIGTQLLVSIGVGIFLELGVAFLGWSDNVLTDDYTIPITIITFIASFVATWLVLRYLNKIPEDVTFVSPPPPPNF